ncbi:MAG: RsmB/NOP family class I SAM-dependent RNA methyltransferase [Lewinellaceae bacterium]|nr:RsmB/NOP family class I SAM-dependent RNA methyltransferase [Saprospiraceae bacterium]MCB9311252.1 RsmB/NOP family class I SAM-dependent RNA methyltransferase [Lewinellaceae bacterium]
MSMKLYPNLVRAVDQALRDIVERPYPADKVLARLFKQSPQWGSRDRSFVAETTYDILRYLRRYADPAKPPIYWPNVIGWHLRSVGYELPDWEEWHHLPEPPYDWDAPDCPLAVRESISDWMDEKGRTNYGDRWPDLLHALNQPADVILRVNPVKATATEVMQALLKVGLEAEILAPLAIRLTRRANVFRLPAFRDGWFEVQDFASQQVATALDPQPGQRVVDGCAGAGGKTLQIAGLMANRGQIIALDPDEWKLKELRQRASRAGLDNIQTKISTDTKSVKRLHGSADRVLLDVPCTGSGVLRRNPDAKWRIDQELLDRCLGLQRTILDQYAPVCKPGARMVYATCSIFREENQDQIKRFLADHPSFSLIEEAQLLPDEFGYDGFFIAVLQAP